MHVAEILFYNMYIPPYIRGIINKYYGADQSNIDTLYKLENQGEFYNRKDILLKYLVNEDVQISANSSYTTLNDFSNLGTIGELADTFVATAGGYSGAVGQDHNNFRNIFNYSLWDKTDPMNINFKIVLYAKTDPLVDVVIPAYLMMSHAGLDKIFGDASGIKFAVPGVSFVTAMNLYNRRKAKKEEFDTDAQTAAGKLGGYTYESKESTRNTWVFYETGRSRSESTKKVIHRNEPIVNSKLLSFLINGLIYIDIGMIKSVSVTCSKHTAKTNATYGTTVKSTNAEGKPVDGIGSSIFEGDFPIWMELDLQIESIRPAVSYMLWNSLNGNNILNRKEDQNGIRFQ